MQWYLYNKERLKVEIELMERNGVNFQLYQDKSGNLFWRGSLHVLGHYHDDVRLVYPEDFPFKQIVIYVLEPKLPIVNIHIHADGSICVMKSDEWSPDWTAYAMYLKTIEFLHAFYSGKMDNSLPTTYIPIEYETRKSFMDRILEALQP